jgi:hypothetical protein
MGAISDNLVPFFEAHSLIFVMLFYLWYLVIHSDVFMVQILSKVDGAVEGNYTSTVGTLIQGALLIIVYFVTLIFVSMVL